MGLAVGRRGVGAPEVVVAEGAIWTAGELVGAVRLMPSAAGTGATALEALGGVIDCWVPFSSSAPQAARARALPPINKVANPRIMVLLNSNYLPDLIVPFWRSCRHTLREHWPERPQAAVIEHLGRVFAAVKAGARLFEGQAEAVPERNDLALALR
jgi:hypothetical protein